MPTINDLRDTYTVEVNLDDKASDQTDRLRQAFDNLSQSAEQVSGAHSMLGASAKAAADAQASLTQIVSDFGARAGQTPQQMGLISDATNKISTAAGNAATAIGGMRTALAQQAGNALGASLDEAGKAADSFSDKMDKVVVSVGPRGRTGSILGGLKDMVSATTSTIAGVFTSLGSLGQGSQDADSKVSKLGDTFGSLGGWLSRVDDQLTTTKDSTKAVNEATDQAAESIKKWGERIGSVVGPITAVIAAGLVMGEQYRQHQRDLDALATSLSGVRDNYTAVAQQIEATGRALHAMGPISVQSAQDAAKTIASSPNFAPSLDLSDLTRTAEKLASATGTSIQSTAQKISAALGDTAAAAKTANAEGLKGFDDNLVAMIDLLQKSGDRLQAFSLYMDALKKSSADAKEALTPLQQAWRDLMAQFDPANNPIGRYFASWIDWIENKLAGAVATVTGVMKEFNQWITSKFPQAYGPGGQAVPTTSSYAYSAGTPLTGMARDVGISAPNKQFIDDALSVLNTKIPEALRDGFEGFATRVLQTESTGNMKDPVTGKILTSKAGNIGLMQIGPAVIQDYEQKAANIFSRSGDTQSAQTPQGNVNIGSSFLVDLYNKYDHDIVKTAIAWNWGPKFADEFFAGQRQTLPAETVKFVQQTTGIGYDQLQSAFPQLQQGGFKQQLYRDANASSMTSDISAQRRDAEAEIAKLQKAMDAARDDAQRASMIGDDDAWGKATRQIAEYHDKLDKATAALANIRSASQQASDTLVTDADKSAAHVSGEAEKIYDLKVKLDDIAKKSGEPFDQAAYDTGVAAIRSKQADDDAQKQTDLADKYEKATKAMGDANTLAIAYAKSQHDAGTVTKESADYIAEYTKLQGLGLEPGEKFNELLKERLKTMGDATQVKYNAAALQDVKDFDAQDDKLREQIVLIGQSTRVQGELVAEMEERHKWHKSLTDDLTEEQQQAVNAAKANADLKDSLVQQKQAVQELGQMFSSAFDSVANSITDAFVKGKGAAIDFGGIMKGLAAQIAKDFLQLSILNPLSNMVSLGGQAKPTLSTLFSAISSMSGAAGGGTGSLGQSGVSPEVDAALTRANGGSSPFGSMSNASTVFQAGNALTGGSIYTMLGNAAVNSGLIGTGSGIIGAGGSLSGAGGLFYGGMSAETAAMANAPLAAGEVGVTAGGSATAGSGAGALGSLGSTTIMGAGLGSWAGGIGAGFAAGSMAGGAVQGALNKTGPGPMIGAGLGAVGGAAVGTMILPGIGTIIGGLLGGTLGGAGGGLIGPHVASTYSSQMMGLSGGMLSTGAFLSQRDPNAQAEQAAFLQQATDINKLLQANNVFISQQKGMIQLGDNTPGGFQDPTKWADLNAINVTGKTALQQYQFSSNDPILSQKLSTQDFATTAQLQTYLTGFSQAQAQTKEFLSETTAMLKNLGVTTGSVHDTITQLNAAFDTNKAAGDALINSGFLSSDQVTQMAAAENQLSDARDRAVKETVDAANAQIDASDAGLNLRNLSARANITGSAGDAQTAQLTSFDVSAVQQRQQFSAQMVALYGDTIKGTDWFNGRMAALERTLGAERLAIVTQYAKQMADAQKAVAQGDQSEVSRYMQAQASISGTPGDAVNAQLYSFDAQAQQQREALDKQLVGIYGDTVRSAVGYAGEMALLERTLGAERVAIIKAYWVQIAAQQKAVAQGDQAEIVRYMQAHATNTGSPGDALAAQLYAFDIQAQQQRDSLDKQLTNIYGDSVRATVGYAGEMALLERTMGEERLAIQKQYNDRLAQSAQASVTNLQTYAAKLMSSNQAPLSPQSQYSLASSQFNAVSGSAKAGDWTSIQSITGYADALLQASGSLYGTGTQYVADFKRVLDTVNSLASMSPDQLTAAVFRSEARSQTQQLVDALAQIRAEVAALRQQVAQGSAAPARLAA